MKWLAVFFCAATLLMTSGCIVLEPRPHRFTETTNAPVALRQFAGWSDHGKLLLDVTLNGPMPTFYGIEAFNEGGNLYLYPFFDSIFALGIPISTDHATLNAKREYFVDGTNDVLRFTIDPARYHMPADWESHVYWLIDGGAYLFPGPGFWSEKHRDPALRRRIEIRPLASRPY